MFIPGDMRRRREIDLVRTDHTYRHRPLLPVYQLKRSVYSLLDPVSGAYRRDPILQALMERTVATNRDIKLMSRRLELETFEEDLRFLFDRCKFDLVLSDMAPKTSGVMELDKTASAGLCLQTLRTARAAANPAGSAVVMKCLLGPAGADLIRFLKRGAKHVGGQVIRNPHREAWVNIITPEATRHGSSEVFIVLRNLRCNHLDTMLDGLPAHLLQLEQECLEAAQELELNSLAQMTNPDQIQPQPGIEAASRS